MGRIPEKNIEKIIDASNIVDIISEFVPLKRTGKNYMGVCPFHGDKGPSLSVSSDKQLYHCFGCGASGNTVSFVMRIRNLDFIDAIRFLSERTGIPIEEEETDPKKRLEDALRERIYQANIEAARFFFANMKNSPIANTYFVKRGMDKKTVNKFGLGYSPDNWEALYRHLKTKGYDEELILKAGLVIKKENGCYDRFRNRIMFPVFDIKGRIIGFGGRVMDDSKPKYLNSPETPVFMKGTNLYGLNLIAKSGIPEHIIVVEGYMDCISLHQYGIETAVASLGTALTQEQAKLIKRFSKKVYICYDADAAGQTATLRGLEILEQVGCDVTIISIPDGKDPDEFLKKNGAEEFKKLINKSLPVIEYRIQMAKSGKNLKDIRQKSIFIKEIAGILSHTSNEIEIQSYASKIFDETGVDVKNILDEIKKIKNNDDIGGNNKLNIRNNNTSGNIYNLEPAYKKAERFLLSNAVLDDEYFNYIKDSIQINEFITIPYIESAKYIFEKKIKGEDIIPRDLLKNFENNQDLNDVALLFQPQEHTGEMFKLIDDCIRTIRRYNLENRINELTVQIKHHEANNDLVQSTKLSQELIGLQKQLKML